MTFSEVYIVVLCGIIAMLVNMLLYRDRIWKDEIRSQRLRTELAERRNAQLWEELSELRKRPPGEPYR